MPNKHMRNNGIEYFLQLHKPIKFCFRIVGKKHPVMYYKNIQ